MSSEFVLPRRRRRIRPYLDLTAMIDTVFNLLIFFAVATTLTGSRLGIAMQLPSAKTAQPVTERVVLALRPGELPQINGREVRVEEIGPALAEVTAGNLDTQLVVMADQAVQYQALVQALDEARNAGYHRIALATAPEPAKDRE